MNYYCARCGREWDYPVSNCIFCYGKVEKIDTSEHVIDDMVQVSIPTEDHPIIPYYVMLLRGSDGSYKFKKTFQNHEIGDKIHLESERYDKCTIGIIGTGITGRGIAEVALRTGNSIILKSRSRGALDNTLDKLSRNLYKSLNMEESQLLLEKMTTTTDYISLAKADFIIESVVEDLEVKRNIFRILDSICDPDVVLATNTSSLSISKISDGLRYPERVVGLHFFNPITRMQLIEIIKGDKTSDDTLSKCADVAKKLGKVSILAKDTPGFVVNRLLFTLINEACWMLEKGTSSVEEIDKAMKLGANHPMGPFELADLIGLDLCEEIIENLKCDSENLMSHSTNILNELVRKGYLGKKSGRGFYDYNEQLNYC